MLVRQTEGKVRILRFLPDGRRLVVVTEQPDAGLRFAILDIATGESIPLLESDCNYEKRALAVHTNVVAIHPSGEWLIIAWAGKLASFQTKDGSVLPVPVVWYVSQVLMSPRGDRMLVVESTYANHHTLIAYEIRPGKVTQLWQMKMPGDFYHLAGIFSDGERLASIEDVVQIRDLGNGRALASTGYDSPELKHSKLSADGRFLVGLGHGPKYVVLDFEQLTNPRIINASGTFGNFVSSALHPSNGTMAVIHDGPKLLKIYSLATLEQVQVYKWNLGPLCSVDFSPDGMTGAVGSEDGSILIWDVE